MDQNSLPVNHSNTSDDEIDLRALIITLVKGWKIILASTVIVTVLSGIYAYRLPDQYVVTTKAATVGGGSSNSQMAGLAALAGVNLGSNDEDVDLLEHIDVVVKKAYFMDSILSQSWELPRVSSEEGIITFDTVTLEQFWKVPKSDTTKYDWEYRKKMHLYNRLRHPKSGHIAVDNKKGILEIKTKFTNPHLAFQIHGYLIQLLKQYFENDYKNRDKEKRVFVENRLKEVSISLKESEHRLVKFREKNLQIMAPAILLQGERLQREVELQASLYKELMKQLELAKIEEKKQSPVFEILQEGELPLTAAAPNRKNILMIGAIAGFLFSALGIIVNSAIRKNASSKKT